MVSVGANRCHKPYGFIEIDTMRDEIRISKISLAVQEVGGSNPPGRTHCSYRWNFENLMSESILLLTWGFRHF